MYNSRNFYTYTYLCNHSPSPDKEHFQHPRSFLQCLHPVNPPPPKVTTMLTSKNHRLLLPVLKSHWMKWYRMHSSLCGFLWSTLNFWDSSGLLQQSILKEMPLILLKYFESFVLARLREGWGFLNGDNHKGGETADGNTCKWMRQDCHWSLFQPPLLLFPGLHLLAWPRPMETTPKRRDLGLSNPKTCNSLHSATELNRRHGFCVLLAFSLLTRRDTLAGITVI